MKALGVCVLAGALLVATSYAGRPLQTGHWGAPGFELIIGADSGHFDSSCAHGTISPIEVNRNGDFEVPGLYFRDGPGPIRGPPGGEPAHYIGTVHHRMMNLTIVLDTGEMIGPFNLTRGKTFMIVKCL